MCGSSFLLIHICLICITCLLLVYNLFYALFSIKNSGSLLIFNFFSGKTMESLHSVGAIAPVLSLKRSIPFSITSCIICQNDINESLRNSTTKGLNTIKEETKIQYKFRDSTFTEAINRIETIFGTENEEFCLWHKKWYFVYTNKGHIKRSQRNSENLNLNDTVSKESNNVAGNYKVNKILRSSLNQLNWKACFVSRTFQQRN